MYECTDCGQKFDRPVYVSEKHGLDNPPFERTALCPACKGSNFRELPPRYCRCCGAKISHLKGEYCSETCEKRGIALRAKDHLRAQQRQTNPLEQIVRQAETYNRIHGTRYSYGQFVALILPKCKKGETA